MSEAPGKFYVTKTLENRTQLFLCSGDWQSTDPRDARLWLTHEEAYTQAQRFNIPAGIPVPDWKVHAIDPALKKPTEEFIP